MIATIGKRDVGFDVTLPMLEQWYRPGMHKTPQRADGFGTVVALNDQHAHIEVPDGAPFQVGDLLSFGVFPPCTTFDRWQLIYEIDEIAHVIARRRSSERAAENCTERTAPTVSPYREALRYSHISADILSLSKEYVGDPSSCKQLIGTHKLV